MPTKAKRVTKPKKTNPASAETIEALDEMVEAAANQDQKIKIDEYTKALGEYEDAIDANIKAEKTAKQEIDKKLQTLDALNEMQETIHYKKEELEIEKLDESLGAAEDMIYQAVTAEQVSKEIEKYVESLGELENLALVVGKEKVAREDKLKEERLKMAQQNINMARTLVDQLKVLVQY